MLRAVLYEVQRGHHSPAVWHRDAAEAEPVRWLLRGCTPSRSCWYAFRDRIAPFLDAWHRQVLHQAVAGGLTPATRGAEDGTLVAANASRHKMVAAATLDKRAAELAAAVAADEQAATAAAVAADEGGATTAAVGAWMAKTPPGRRTQQKRLKQAQERMDALQTRNRGKRSSKRKAADKVVVSLSDPEAAAGRDKEKVFRPLYNVQVVDDVDSPFVLGYEVFAQQNDAGLLATMLTRLTEGLGHGLRTLLADTAYAGGADLAAAGVTVYAPTPADETKKEKQIPKSQFHWLGAEATYTCPEGHRLAYEGSSRQKRSGTETVELHRYRCPPRHCRECPLRQRCTPNPAAGRSISRGEHEALIEALRARMATAEAKALYRLRSQTVELVNADWKQHRKLRRFSGRGLTRVRCQVGLVVLAHNLVTLLSEEKKAREKKARAADVKPPEAAT
jgi:transposase